ncbi:MAG: MotA/TolQ/ExbB proton channel family protein [Candidatus Hydrothermales bacterium]
MSGIITLFLIGQQGVIESLVDYFHKGGGVMWLLLIVAILSVVIIIERFYTLFRLRTNPRRFVVNVIDLLETEGLSSAMDYCSKNSSVVAKICQAVLEKAGSSKEIIEENVARRATSELAFLDRGMLWLASFTTIAPILGFLGTVTGMIRAFQAVAAAGEVEPTLVAAGISEALITTATGLLIAAPVAIFHTFFSSRINAFSREMEEAANTLIEYVLEAKVK